MQPASFGRENSYGYGAQLIFPWALNEATAFCVKARLIATTPFVANMALTRVVLICVARSVDPEGRSTYWELVGSRGIYCMEIYRDYTPCFLTNHHEVYRFACKQSFGNVLNLLPPTRAALNTEPHVGSSPHQAL